jgi:hypothetical protein
MRCGRRRPELTTATEDVVLLETIAMTDRSIRYRNREGYTAND